MKLTALLPLSLSLVGCSLSADESPASLENAASQAGQCGPTEVHVFSTYTVDSHTDEEGPFDANVQIDRPGKHVLVLSAYEATNWRVTLGPGAKVEAVHLIGYEAQTVDVPNVPVTVDQGCGYSWPYDGQGCDTNELLAIVKSRTGQDPTTFHGCYDAGRWRLKADGRVTSDCDFGPGYEVDEILAECIADAPGCGNGGGEDCPPAPRDSWKKYDFETYAPAACTGDRFARYDATYDVWVGAVLCGSADQYKLYMSYEKDEPFLEIADFSGYGQDHCELVDPAFKLPNDDDITSGGCTACSLGELVDVIDAPIFGRSAVGQPFTRRTATDWGDLTTSVYSCGVSIP